MKCSKSNHIRIIFLLKRSRPVLLLFLVVMCISCAHDSNITLYYSGNYYGRIDGCSCPKEPAGNILNHYGFYLDSIRTDTSNLYLCTGNLFSYNSRDKQNIVIMDIFDSLGYGLIAPGKNDISFVQELTDKKAVCYNIKGASEYRIIDIKGLKIAITSLTDPSYSKYINDSGINHLSIPELAEFAEMLKMKCDMLIIVSNMESGAEKNVFNQIRDIDVMISNTNTATESVGFSERSYLSHGPDPDNIGVLEIRKQGGIISFSNSFIEINKDGYSENSELLQKIDSLKLKYNIENKAGNSDF